MSLVGWLHRSRDHLKSATEPRAMQSISHVAVSHVAMCIIAVGEMAVCL
jgi:hypothetical protein